LLLGRRTLHPTFPFISLFSIQEPEVLVGSLHSAETSGKAKQVEETKRPGIELLLLLQPKSSAVREEDDGGSNADNHASAVFHGRAPDLRVYTIDILAVVL